MEVVTPYVFNPDGSTEREIMLNNKKFSDTTFLVNDTQFYVSSHIVRVYSPVLDAMIDEHFKHCGDLEIKIGLIKDNDSFNIVLRYMYGLSINFTEKSKAVLCEVLCLSQRYTLPKLTNELKNYLSQIENFQIESVVVFLNVAKRFCLEELFGKLFSYSKNNADQLVSHESFADLQYDILRDLVKCDDFCTKEINILNCVLVWHNSNMTKKNTEEESHEKVKDSTSTQEATGEDLKAFKSDILKSEETSYFNQSKDSEETSCSNQSKDSEGTSCSKEGNKHDVDYETCLSVQNMKLEESLETFSQNVLKTLLSHIRIDGISVLELHKLFHTEIGMKYKGLLGNFEQFSLSSSPRSKNDVLDLHNGIKVVDVTKEFSIHMGFVQRDHTVYSSNEEYVIGDMKWKMLARNRRLDSSDLEDVRIASLTLQCTSDQLCDWECSVQCQVKMTSIIPTLTFPTDSAYRNVIMTSQESLVDLAEFYFPYSWRQKYRDSDAPRTDCNKWLFTVHFKQIIINMKEKKVNE